MMVSTNAFIYFKEYKDDEQSLTCPSERCVKTVNAFVTVLDGMMAEVAHTHIQLKRKLQLQSRTPLILDGLSSGSLHHQEIVDGIARSVTRISIPCVVQARNRSLMEASRQRATRRKMKILLHMS
jgi:radical SAM superfamily enzyme with C-terminal helix-hairpin-helix motif